MPGPVDDLLPLFLAEAGERLEALGDLLEGVPDEDGAASARRQLHALKGASRMMGLSEVSELCHRAEELLQQPAAEVHGELVEVVDLVARRVAELAEASGPGPPAATAPAAGGEGEPTADGLAAVADVRLATSALDLLADRAARLRVLAVAAGGMGDRMFQLSALAESGVGERSPEQVLATLATSLRQLALDFEGGQRSLRRLADRQLEALLSLQVQPLRPFLVGLGRHARELARSLDKRVEVAVEAGASQLDRRIIDALRESFLHLLRNAVDHGIEPPEIREAAGKPAAARITLAARSEADRVVIEVRDDGGGIDREALRRRAAELGVETAAPSGDDRGELLRLLAVPGLSTRREVTDISGRGVGLDAVAAAVRRVGGDLRVESEPGAGTTFVIEVPLARRGERILVVRVGEWTLAIPAVVARGYHRLDAAGAGHASACALPDVDGEAAPVRVMSEILGGEPVRGAGVAIECHGGGARVWVVVDRVLGEEEVFVRAVPPGAGLAPLFQGVALLASGKPVPVLGALDRVLAAAPLDHASADRAARSAVLRVLLVDDSKVTREMVRRLLEDGGVAVTAVAGADEALDLLRVERFDCVVTDIEMPGLDGLELTRRLRASAVHSNLPIVVVSTRDRPLDRLAGLDAGADAYLTKQGLDARELVQTVQRLGGRR